MTTLKKAVVLATGFSMFSMFFGAGNVVFPLVLGQTTGEYVNYAALGLILTGVILPFLGLFSMTLFNGDYKTYFYRLGTWPALFIIFLLMAIIGPLAAMPRTVTLSQATMALSGVDLPTWLFNGLFCLVIFALSYKRSKVVDILGYWLTPLLVLLLAILIVVGLFQPAENPPVGAIIDLSPVGMFWHGALTGYNTMDLLASVFFSTVVIFSLQAYFANVKDETVRKKQIMQHTLYASIIGAVLLGLVYVGFALLASKYSFNLQDIEADALIAHINYHVLGNAAGWVINGIVSLACLTTAIALACVFSEVMSELLTKSSRYYHAFLVGTVLITYAMSFIGFSGLVALIVPLLIICYPAIIVLAFCNMAYKLWGFKYVKTPVFATAGISLILYLL